MILTTITTSIGEGCIQNTEIYTFYIFTIITISSIDDTYILKFQCLNVFCIHMFGLVGKV